jgi:acetylornithine/succinyldiaminopimelate/putrescine aminotransferase
MVQRLRDFCTAQGTLLIIDEVKSGFRVAKGGAQALYGINADLTTYAKAMGNGYPVAAFGGRADVMDVVGANAGAVVHGGTYTANLVGLSAAHCTLDILTHTDACKPCTMWESVFVISWAGCSRKQALHISLQDLPPCWVSTSPPPCLKPTATGARPTAACTASFAGN